VLSRSFCKIDIGRSRFDTEITKTAPMRPDRKLVTCLLALWFFAALLLGASSWFSVASAPMVAVTVWGLTGLALLACWKIPSVRAWSFAVDLRVLIALHLIRFIAGICLLLDSRAGKLSSVFAQLAGPGDIIVAIAAAIILAVPSRFRSRGLVFMWNLIGLVDILLVVADALIIGLHDWPSMAPLRELPLSLLPTFVVPLVIVSHVLIFVRLARPDTIVPTSK
jgi:hypothetical protein